MKYFEYGYNGRFIDISKVSGKSMRCICSRMYRPKQIDGLSLFSDIVVLNDIITLNVLFKDRYYEYRFCEPIEMRDHLKFLLDLLEISIEPCKELIKSRENDKKLFIFRQLMILTNLNR